MDRTDTPLPARLRAAAEGLFLRGEAPGPYEELLRQHPAELLRHVAERRDPRLLSRALRSGFFTAEHAAQAERTGRELPYPIRLLLQHPDLAESIPAEGPEAPAGENSDIDRPLFDIGVAYPFLRSRLSDMERLWDREIRRLGTDGLRLYLPAGGGKLTDADVQHTVLHCVFRHMLPPEDINRPLWDLACDVACEYLRSELFPSADSRDIRLTVADALPAGCDPRYAAAVYRGLMEVFEDELDALRPLARDDHRYWYALPPGLRPQSEAGGGPGGGGSSGGEEKALAELHQKLEELWQPAAAKMSDKKQPSRRYGLAPGSREEKMLLRQQGKYDFTRYLRRFSTMREEMQLDLNSFDYIPYYYGLERYGNLPFLEPLETSESYKIEELVIAIDTSGSCSKETVERFLGEIQRILMQRENFFRKMELHIMQCDAILQDDTEIRSPEDWKRYLTDLRIKGRGGTNFNPVFDRVEKLQSQGKLQRLRGLMYFTDGDGVYPRKKPPYETAFVFTDRSALERKLPEWIIPLCLDNTE